MQIDASNNNNWKKNRNEKPIENVLYTKWMDGALNNLLIILLNVVIYKLFTCET